MPFYDVTNIFVNSKFPKAGKSLVIYRFSIINISKSIRRTASKPTSFESQDLFNANDKSSDNEIYRFVLQKTSLFLGGFFTISKLVTSKMLWSLLQNLKKTLFTRIEMYKFIYLC